MMMKPDLMTKALQNKKGNFDITIILGGPDENEQKEVGLAPDAAEGGDELNQDVVGDGELAMPEHADAEQDKNLIQSEMTKAGLGKSSLLNRLKK